MLSQNESIIRLPKRRFIYSTGKTRYTVNLNNHTCTCPYSVNQSKKDVNVTCKHLTACQDLESEYTPAIDFQSLLTG